jgi:hypothetical protein
LTIPVLEAGPAAAVVVDLTGVGDSAPSAVAAVVEIDLTGEEDEGGAAAAAAAADDDDDDCVIIVRETRGPG